MGINVQNINALIKKNNLYLSSFNDDSLKLKNSIKGLNDCYSGSDLSYLFSEPNSIVRNIQTMSTVIQSYSDVLTQARVSYQKQDENIGIQIDRMNSKL